MDIYCPKCGEPWDHDGLHEVAQERYGKTYYISGNSFGYDRDSGKNPEYNEDEYQKVFAEVSKEFRIYGCGKVFGNRECVARKNNRTLIAEAAYELLGDDLDGAAAMFEDYGA